MAKQILRWISPFGLATTGAVVLGIAGTLLLLMAGIAMVVEVIRPTIDPVGIGIGELAMFALLPFAYAAFGWLLGYLVAVVFNRVSRYTGGISIDVSEEAEPAPRASRASASDGADRSSLPDAIG